MLCLRLIAPLLGIVLLSACALSSTKPATALPEPSVPAEAPASLLVLANSQWQVLAVNNGRQADSSVHDGSTLTLAFDTAGRVKGNFGCNRFSAPYTEVDNSLRFGPVASTRKLCAEPARLMAQEAQMLAALASVASWHLEDTHLVLRSETGAVALVMNRETMPGTAAQTLRSQVATLFGTAWVVEDIDGAGVIENSRATLHFEPDGRVYGHSSCNTYRGHYNFTSEGITVSQLASTKMACAPSLTQQEQRFHAALTAVHSFAFNAEGALLLFSGEQRRILARR
jgi:heat shock protein HslJ